MLLIYSPSRGTPEKTKNASKKPKTDNSNLGAQLGGSPAGALRGDIGDPKVGSMSKSMKKRLRKKARDAEWNAINHSICMFFSHTTYRRVTDSYCLITGSVPVSIQSSMPAQIPGPSYTTAANDDDKPSTKYSDSNDDQLISSACEILKEYESREAAELEYMVNNWIEHGQATNDCLDMDSMIEQSHEYDLEKKKNSSKSQSMVFKV